MKANNNGPEELHHFVRVDFTLFKAFERFTLHLRSFNILVGPNNAGKSTILAAFRILAAAHRKASSRNPELIPGPRGETFGYSIDLNGISVAQENLFYNYDNTTPASVKFTLSNGNKLVLFFPERERCYLIPETGGAPPRSTKSFKQLFNCPVGFVPILGPVDHDELLYQEEAARLALFNYTAARNFRNIWHHYRDRFPEFRQMLNESWPGMDIEPPKVDYSSGKPRLHMFCPEERIPREIFWAGFGFQVWCQMLTHLVQSKDKALFLIDEPDIYLHADLQRQLLVLLRNLGPDIIIATHSTEIITEAEADDIVLVNKKRKSARRIKQPSELSEIFLLLGSNLNPILTQLAKTRRAIFVEGNDFQIIGKIARKLEFNKVSSRSDFAVIPVEGFNPERIRTLKKGIETTLGGEIAATAIFDRDFRSQLECDSISEECRKFCRFVSVHGCKEIENFLLCPKAIDRAAAHRLADRSKRSGKKVVYVECAQELLDAYADEKKNYIASQFITSAKRFGKLHRPGFDESHFTETALAEFEGLWQSEQSRYHLLPGKDALAKINQNLETRYGISVSPTAIIDQMKAGEVPEQLKALIKELEEFAFVRPGTKAT